LVLFFIVFRGALFSPGSPLVETFTVRTGSAGTERDTGTGTVLNATGYVMPRIKASVSPRVTGQLVELLVDVGSEVEEGDLLGRIANDDLKAQKRQIEAEIASQRALLEEALANHEDLQLEFDRQENLIREGAVSQSSYDAAKTALKVASARVTSAEALLDNANAMLDVVGAEIEKTLILAPFNGIILRKEAEVGEIVGPRLGSGSSRGSTSLVTMCDMSSLEVEVDVNEAYISRLREGMAASIILDAAPRKSYPGIIRKIVPTANRQKATVQVKVAFSETDETVMPEMGAQVSFAEESTGDGMSTPVIWAPATAIRRWDGGTVVYIVENGEARVVPVESGPATGGQVQIFSGLEGGEIVIRDPPEGLEPGRKVRTNKE
jgi:RND family efflux transporter MFP subunit